MSQRFAGRVTQPLRQLTKRAHASTRHGACMPTSARSSPTNVIEGDHEVDAATVWPIANYIRHPNPAGFRRLEPWLGTFFGGAGLGAAAVVVTGVEEFVHFGVLVGAVLGAMCFGDARYPVEVPKAQRPAARRQFGCVRNALGGGTGGDTYRLWTGDGSRVEGAKALPRTDA